jgi:hypothetical protein
MSTLKVVARIVREKKMLTQELTEVNHHPRIDKEVIENFKSKLRGGLYLPGESGYEQARSIWNGMFARRPGWVARCTGVADVIAAVTFARDNDLLLSVRGGGHNVAGSAVCEGGLMIDLSLMRGIHVDPEKRIARVQPGGTWIGKRNSLALQFPAVSSPLRASQD